MVSRGVDQGSSKVPEVTLIFWLIKIAATTLGDSSRGGLPDPREKISSGSVLGDDRRIDDGGHAAG